MPNVEIEDNNLFSSNTDAVDLNTKVISYFIDKEYYLKEYLPQETYRNCDATLYIDAC